MSQLEHLYFTKCSYKSSRTEEVDSIRFWKWKVLVAYPPNQRGTSSQEILDRHCQESTLFCTDIKLIWALPRLSMFFLEIPSLGDSHFGPGCKAIPRLFHCSESMETRYSSNLTTQSESVTTTQCRNITLVQNCAFTGILQHVSATSAPFNWKICIK